MPDIAAKHGSMCIYIYAHTYTYVHSYVHIYLNCLLRLRVETCLSVCTCYNDQKCVHMSVFSVCIYIHIYIYT